MNALTEQVLDFARSWGAALGGVATRETLAGGPPSADLEYVLPGARSARQAVLEIRSLISTGNIEKEDQISAVRLRIAKVGLALNRRVAASCFPAARSAGCK